MPTSRPASRRQFLMLVGATTLIARTAETAPAQEAEKPVAPSDRVRIALLGGGGMGQGDTQTALKLPGVELVAVADIYDGRFGECREKFGKDIHTTRDYRELLERRDVDAVIVASPDHWHARIRDALHHRRPRPSRVYCSGGLRYCTDGREIPDVMVAVFDYPARGGQPAFNLTLKVNFVDGGVTSEWGETGFRFVGNEGLLALGGAAVTVSRRPSLAKDWDQEPSKDASLAEATRHRFAAPNGYDERLDHFRNFFAAVRSRQPVVEDGLFGLRAAAPSLLCNLSYDKRRPVGWDPETFKIVDA